ncbi:MAG: hypothetical protein MK141_09610 [Pseudoxanthomonas sp.]|jgi:hypothetical protein|uniref:hypothetical protein n=1 Tax=Pseudoxanthomonas TaxID=83618 RepID=UPI00138A0951|nr:MULTISPECIES: hypothetical protein [Pseudoxanthomonas]MCH2091812.1 hypothetical protein [Pseudoxanthomonas sp.]
MRSKAMTHRVYEALGRALILESCSASVLVGLLAVFETALPAVAEPADERTVETLVFVGELVSMEPMPDPCEEERKRTGTPGCIFMDDLYRARYRVVQPVAGTTANTEVTFQVADHYGFPAFANTPHALLFVAVTDDGNWLHKYQGVPMHRTTNGQWAACGEVDYRGVDEALSHRAKPLTFAEPVARRDAVPREAWKRMQSWWKERPDTYRIKDGQVRCLKGIPVQEAYEIVRQGVMKAREVPLPPWPTEQ